MSRNLPRWLAALGLLLLIVAPILRLAVTPLLAQAPVAPGADGFLNHVSTGTVTGLFDLTSGAPRDPVAVTRTETTRGDAAAAAQVLSQGWNVGVYSTLSRVIGADQKVYREDNYRLAADRRTAALVDCCGVFVGGVVVPMAGAGYPLRFPALLKGQDYPFFDVNLLAAAPMKYLGVEKIAGMSAMKFQQSTPPTAVGKLAVPGRLVGSKESNTTAERAYAANRTLWVDPITGIILRKSERTRETLRDAGGKDVLTLYSANLDSTSQQTAAEVQAAKRAGRPILWANVYGPLAATVLGTILILIAAGAMISSARMNRIQVDFGDDWANFDDLHD